MSCKSFGRPLMRQHKELVLAPTTYLFCRTQPQYQRSLNLLHHRLASSSPVSLAQAVCLVNGDPKYTKWQASPREIFKLGTKPILELYLAGLYNHALAAFPAGQRILVLCGMKDDCRSDAATNSVP